MIKLSMLLFAAALFACSAVAPAQSELKASSGAVTSKAAVTPPAVSAQPAEVPARVAPTSDAPANAALTRVSDPSAVCMVNDQYMGNPQIPVLVGDKTYFGCCKMCEAKLKNNPEVRSAVDPTSQQPVDKATAVIARDASGKVFYFESEQTLAKYETKS